MFKNKYFVCALALLLITNTNYFWEGTLGPFAILELIAIAILLVISLIGFFKYFILSVKYIFKDKEYLILLISILSVLIIFFSRPYGLINWENFESKDVLIADYTGSANCSTLIKLKENGKFKLRNVCFGVYEENGSYIIKRDTIWFNYSSKNGFKYGVLKEDRFKPGKKALYLYTPKDTITRSLSITKNNFDLN